MNGETVSVFIGDFSREGRTDRDEGVDSRGCTVDRAADGTRRVESRRERGTDPDLRCLVVE